MENKRKVAVVGAGIAGIISIACLKEEGIEPFCFEQTDKYGGTWYYREESVDGIASIMPTTIINHSKEVGAFSLFPPRKEYNNYMRHREMFQYITEFVNHFDLERHIRYHSSVTAVRRADDYEKTGRWIVTMEDTLTSVTSSDVYDGVMICVGHINRTSMPNYPEQENFKGSIIHSHSLKEVTGFKGKNVVVVGFGCSALDAAVEISSISKQVYLSTRSGGYVINRVGPKGYPIDYYILTRFLSSFLEILPAEICSLVLEKLFIDPKFHHKLYPVRPKYHVLCRDPVLNDHIGSKLLSGSVIMKNDIDHFTENGVVFRGDTSITEADTIIMATGYTWQFPFLEEGVLVHEEDRFNLYKCTFPTQMKHSTLAIIGFFLPFGPGFPPAELQCRWVARVFSGQARLPSERKMIKDVIKRHKKNKKRYSPSDKMSIRVDMVHFMDQLAKEIGVKPNLAKLFFTDIMLYWKVMFGPAVSYQYRLRGPHKWNGARKAIMTSKERMLWPLKNN